MLVTARTIALKPPAPRSPWPSDGGRASTGAAASGCAGDQPRCRRARASHRLVPPRRLLEDAGFTLVELLVASVAAIVVFSATLVLLHSSQQVQARDSEWALVMQEDRAGLARMVRDMRQATKVEEAKPGKIVFLATIGGKSWKISYECGVAQSGTTFTECLRLAAEAGNALPGTGPATARDVLNGSAVFSYSPSTAEPKLVTAKIELPAKGTLKQAGSSGYNHNVVLEDGAFMRNLYPEG
jgi:type II secretory pathway pseudopilin PulG